MTRWKARVRLHIRHNWTFSLALTVEAPQGKTYQDSLLSGGGRSAWTKISGEGVVPGEYFFGFYKTIHILLSDSANCTVLRTVVWHNTGVWQTDGRTDGITVASTELAMGALRRAVKIQNLVKFVIVRPAGSIEYIRINLKFGIVKHTEGSLLHITFSVCVWNPQIAPKFKIWLTLPYLLAPHGRHHSPIIVKFGTKGYIAGSISPRPMNRVGMGGASQIFRHRPNFRFLAPQAWHDAPIHAKFDVSEHTVGYMFTLRLQIFRW